jgi:hypothetical protein
MPNNGPALYAALVYVQNCDVKGKTIQSGLSADRVCKDNVARIVFVPLNVTYDPSSNIYTDWTPVTWDALQTAIAGRNDSFVSNTSTHWNAFGLTEAPHPGLVSVYWNAWQQGDAVMCEAKTQSVRMVREYAKQCLRMQHDSQMVWRIGQNVQMVGPYVAFNMHTGFNTTETIDIETYQVDRWCNTAFMPKQWGLLPTSVIKPDSSLKVHPRGALCSVVATVTDSDAVCVYPILSPESQFYERATVMLNKWISDSQEQESFTISSNDLLQLKHKGVSKKHPLIFSWSGSTGRVDVADEDVPSLHNNAMVDDILRLAINSVYVSPMVKNASKGESMFARPTTDDNAVIIELSKEPVTRNAVNSVPYHGDAWIVVAPMRLANVDLGRRPASGWSLRRNK